VEPRAPGLLRSNII